MQSLKRYEKMAHFSQQQQCRVEFKIFDMNETREDEEELNADIIILGKM